MSEWIWESLLRQCDLEAIADLLRRDPGAAQLSDDNYTPATFAVVTNCFEDIPCLDVLPLLAAAGADLDAFSGRRGQTPLCAASQYDNLRAVKMLLELGASPHQPDGDGYAPIHYAAYVLPGSPPESLEILALLLQAGADPNAPDSAGSSPIDLAYETGCGEAFRLLQSYGARLREKAYTDGAELVMAALEGDLAAVDTLLTERGLEVDARDRSNRTALHVAALSGDTTMLAHLLALGADPNARMDAEEEAPRSETIISPKAGQAPLHLAADAGYPEVVRLLLAAGADVEAPSEPHAAYTRLLCATLGAAFNRRSPDEARETLRVLIEGGADVRAAVPSLPIYRRTALSAAAWLAGPEEVALLLAHGAVRTSADLLPAMHAATVDNGYRNLPTLWAYGQSCLVPPVRLMEMLPYVDGTAIRILLGEFEDVSMEEPLTTSMLNEADPTTGETPLQWVRRHLRVERDLNDICFTYDDEDVAALLRHGAHDTTS